jgi:hypothetical protein
LKVLKRTRTKFAIDFYIDLQKKRKKGKKEKRQEQNGSKRCLGESSEGGIGVAWASGSSFAV